MAQLGFLTPWLLVALLGLPLLFWLLRAVPPAARRLQFPGVALLKGAQDREIESAHTPWWLLMLRMIGLGALILGFAGPVLNPSAGLQGRGPLLVLVDASWPQARQWDEITDRLEQVLLQAEGRSVALKLLTDPSPEAPIFQTPEALRARLGTLAPAPWPPEFNRAWGETAFETLWLSDGLGWEGREALAQTLAAQGPLSVIEPLTPLYALRPPRFEDGAVVLDVLRRQSDTAETLEIHARGTDPAGMERVLLRENATFGAGETLVSVRLSPPLELRNRLSRFEIAAQPHAGSVALTDDRLRRRKVALVAPSTQETLSLLSPLHYLREALRSDADVFEGTLEQSLAAKPDVIALADVASLPPEESSALADWVAEGGMLLRFAGPRLAASDLAFSGDDPLLPVRLRAGGRSLDGALSWGEPKHLAPFGESSPFYGLVIPQDITVATQVIAEPSPTLSTRVLAELEDGTPLVTRDYLDAGQVVLFHVTANAGWSTLPLSELFIQMLGRLTVSAGAIGDAELMQGTLWTPDQTLTAQGTLAEPLSQAPVAGEDLAEAVSSAALPPGLYAGENRRFALNALGAQSTLTEARWPLGTSIERAPGAEVRPLKGLFLGIGALLLLFDCLATLFVSGRWRGAGVAVLLAAALLQAPQSAEAQGQDPFAATRQVVLAHVLTGDARVDAALASGLEGLGQVLGARTTILTGPPMGIDIETDELSFFPLLYWPITATTPLPSRAAYARLNRYLQTGGMILFDTRDADLGAFGATPASTRLQTLALGLDIPALEALPSDHILTRSFYLLKSVAGRYAGGDVWVEVSSPPTAEGEVRGQNDNVTPVVIGANDWASAWAAARDGTPLYQVGSGLDGAAQREAAYRFGVNLVMHVLTGNYKSDQVHVPELLERLGR